jgi:hypothetical protein
MNILVITSDVLPNSFDLPLFWNEEELTELKGTTMLRKSLSLSFSFQSHKYSSRKKRCPYVVVIVADLCCSESAPNEEHPAQAVPTRRDPAH